MNSRALPPGKAGDGRRMTQQQRRMPPWARPQARPQAPPSALYGGPPPMYMFPPPHPPLPPFVPAYGHMMCPTAPPNQKRRHPILLPPPASQADSQAVRVTTQKPKRKRNRENARRHSQTYRDKIKAKKAAEEEEWERNEKEKIMRDATAAALLKQRRESKATGNLAASTADTPNAGSRPSSSASDASEDADCSGAHGASAGSPTPTRTSQLQPERERSGSPTSVADLGRPPSQPDPVRTRSSNGGEGVGSNTSRSDSNDSDGPFQEVDTAFAAAMNPDEASNEDVVGPLPAQWRLYGKVVVNASCSLFLPGKNLLEEESRSIPRAELIRAQSLIFGYWGDDVIQRPPSIGSFGPAKQIEDYHLIAASDRGIVEQPHEHSSRRKTQPTPAGALLFKVVPYGDGCSSGADLCLCYVIVAEGHKRKRYGHFLVERLVALGRKMKARSIYLEVNRLTHGEGEDEKEKNEETYNRAHGLYEKFNFVDVKYDSLPANVKESGAMHGTKENEDPENFALMQLKLAAK